MERMEFLWRRYLTKQASDSEVDELFNGVKQPGTEDLHLEILERLCNEFEVLQQFDNRWQFLADAALLLGEKKEELTVADNTEGTVISLKKKGEHVNKGNQLWKRWVAAAAVIVLLAGSTYFWLKSSENSNTNSSLAYQQPVDFQPGKEGAILTLADGTEVVLDSLGNGIIADEDGTKLELMDGQLAYNPDVEEGAEPKYHILKTPKGRQFNIELSDGTKVWLNAASSIRYPVQFVGNERRVEITGEVYFEVAKKRIAPDNKQSGIAGNESENVPFIVVTKKQVIEVLGTHFNVNAYEDEDAERTTLLEGSVRVTAISHKDLAGKDVFTILKPGEQAELARLANNIKTRKSVDLAKVMAWKDGQFNFEGASLYEVMRQISRWYDVEIVCPENSNIYFGGKMSRSLSLLGVLKALEFSEIDFKIENAGRRIIVLK